MGHRVAILLVTLASAVALSFVDGASAAPRKHRRAASSPWCAQGLGVLGEGTCYSLPKGETKPRALVFFLHGVLDPTKNWQWGQQLAAAEGARARGFAAIMPRGRRGIGPPGMRDFWAWPTAAKAQEKVLAPMLREWAAAKRALEAKAGTTFEKTYVIGFSNGAYFLTSLALRNAFHADGYAAFAGGSSGYTNKERVAAITTRPRFFVGYGEDDVAKDDPISLGILLLDAHWPHRLAGYTGVGHAMNAKQMQDAFDFLTGP